MKPKAMIKKPQFWQIPIIDAQTQTKLPEKEAILRQRLHELCQKHHHIKLASSLAVEDLVIHHMIAVEHLPIEVFTLDTGKLFTHSHVVIEQMQQLYPQVCVVRFYPDAQEAQEYERKFGANAFYQNVTLRRHCCHIRKIKPLNEALVGADAWLTGQRQEQSSTRTELTFVEFDDARNIAKYNPIFDWKEAEVWAYIQKYHLPFNELYQQGYPSIGCEPCTMPVQIGQDIRSGRWWWESRDSKECGLHK